MPIYEYQCRKCGKTFSHLHKRLNEAAPPCPDCQSTDIRKLLSTFSAKSNSSGGTCPLSGQCPASSGQSCSSGCCQLPH